MKTSRVSCVILENDVRGSTSTETSVKEVWTRPESTRTVRPESIGGSGYNV